jgi:hypothetical protein
MIGFGYKTGWLAVQNCDPADIGRVLGGRIGGQVGWQEGIERAYREDEVVVMTPPLAGAGGSWVLAVGQWVARHAESIDLAGLSAALGREVQLFASHRVTEWHRWERAVGGVLYRSFEYVGEIGQVTQWHGEPTDVEVGVGLPSVLDAADDSHHAAVDEQDVMHVAGVWSVDPTLLDGEPAPGPLTVVRLPSSGAPADQSAHRPLVVDITDLISSGMSYDDFTRATALRLRDSVKGAGTDDPS